MKINYVLIDQFKPISLIWAQKYLKSVTFSTFTVRPLCNFRIFLAANFSMDN